MKTWETVLGDGNVASEEQRDVVLAPLLGRRGIDAGAGTGKTTTLALRALYLIESEQLRADELLVVTFTRKAAAEIGSRIADTFASAALAGGKTLDGSVTCLTIHALAASILREFALDFAYAMLPRAVTDGEARTVFHRAFRRWLDGRSGADLGSMPLVEVNVEALERDLAELALRLKNLGIDIDTFEREAVAAAALLRTQTWGQTWIAGSKPERDGRPKRTACEPKLQRTPEDRVREADREVRNVRAVAELLRDFDAELARDGATTYGDLIFQAARNLESHPEVAQKLRTRWRHALVDEYQDTSALQMRFLEAVYGDDPACGIMPVGDYRQSIYGFNGADPAVMGGFRKTADVMYPLTINRRSSREIVDAAHHVLAEAGALEPHTRPLGAFNGAAGPACIRVENFNASGTLLENVRAEAAAIADAIRRLIADGAREQDIAILLRRRTHAQRYVHALNAVGIGAALDRRDGLLQADEVRDAIAWATLAVDLTDKRAAVRVLQSPLVGLSDAVMVRLAASDTWVTAIARGGALDADDDTLARLSTFREYLERSGPCAALPLSAAIELLLRTLPLAQSYEAPEVASVAQAVMNLRNFALLARRFAADLPRAKLSDFVHDLTRRRDYDDDVEEASLDYDGVRILTIHKAKGLEWRHVFVACATAAQYGSTGRNDRVVDYDALRRALAIKHDIDGNTTLRWDLRTLEFDQLTGERPENAAAKSEARLEQARCFYVAMTRAKRTLTITAPGKAATFVKSVQAWFEREHPGHSPLPARDDATEPNPALPAARGVPPPAPIRVQAKPAGAQLSLFTPRLSFTSLSTFETCPRQARYRYRLSFPDLGRVARYAGTGERDGLDRARLGSLAHRALELWGQTRKDGIVRDAGAVFAEAAAEFVDATAAEAALAQACYRAGVAWLAAFTVVAVEMPFVETIAGRSIEGVIDLIAEDAAGTLHVVDYKTGVTGDEHYALQLDLYARVARHRHPGRIVQAAILRLDERGATAAAAIPVPPGRLEQVVAAAGGLDDDTPQVGAWCGVCAYAGGPCDAVLPVAVAAP